MKRFPHITLFTGALMILSGCVHAQTVQNITPHNSQPIMSVITDHDLTGACSNYAQIYVNWKTGAQTACVNGQYQTSTLGGGGGMIYPSAGVPVSSGSGWSSSLTAPSGTLVGTTDAQTLTNKTVDGVSPTTFGYLDPTSSVQTQLNGKQGAITLTTTGISGAATFSGNTLNIPQYSGGSGLSGYSMTASGTGTQTVGTDCSSSQPCTALVGTSPVKTATPASFTVPSGAGSNDTAYIYIDPVSKNLTVGDQTLTLTCTGCTAVTGVTGFPFGSIPLYVATITGGNVASVVDDRAAFSVPVPLTAGNCIVLTPGPSSQQIAVDSTNSACTGGGGTAFNGGTITAPEIISTSGYSSSPTDTTNSPLLKLLISNSGGYNVLALDDDLGDEWQVGVGGSAVGPPLARSLYLYDKKNTRAFFTVDPSTDATTFTSTSATPMQLNGGGQFGSGITLQNTYSATAKKAYVGVLQSDGSLEIGVDLTNGSNYPFHLRHTGVITTTTTGGIEWSSDPTNSSNGTIDTSLIRVSAGVVGVKDSAGNPGTLNAGTFSASGVTGFTGTKTAGTCVLTISGGIITNVTGC